MMKRFLPFLILVLWTSASPAKEFSHRRYSLSLALGSYEPSDTIYQQSYGGPGTLASLRFTYTVKRRIDFDLSAEFFLKDNSKDFTKITWFAGILTPAARYRFLSGHKFQPYFGGGIPLVDFTGQYLIVNPAYGNLAVARVHHSGSGLMFQGGCDLMLYERFVLFAEARFYSLGLTFDREEVGGISQPVYPPLQFNQRGGYFGAGLRFRL